MKKKWNERIPWRGIRFRKIVQIMKWSFVLLFVSCMHLSAAVYSQQERMDISVKDVSVEQLLKTIKAKVDVDFLYNIKEIERNGTVSVDMKNATVEEVLQVAFRGKSLTYNLINGVFIIRPLQIIAQDSVKKMYDVKGKILDNKKQPLPGVTIRLDGTTVGTAADNEGKFVLRIPQTSGHLIFTFVGFKQKKVAFKVGEPLIVILEEDVTDLDEVVVRAYGTQNKRESISAISSVKAEEMKELPSASIAGMLQGRLAGVNIIQQSGAPGSASVIAVRGFNSLLVDGASDGQPLWVIDGVPMYSFVSPVTGTNTLADIDPSMIESVEVLKDAAAASIYGSRAGNGVILVTTKKGKKGKASFSGNVSYSVAQLMEYPTQTGGRMERWMDLRTNRYGRLNITDYSDFEVTKTYYPTSYEEVWGTNGQYDYFWGSGKEEEAMSNRQLQDSLDPYYNNETNWFKYAFRTGRVVNANLQASGGSDKFLYMVGIGYYDEKGIMINSGYSRANIISNLSAQLNPKMKLDTRIYLSYVDRTMNKTVKNVMDKSRYEGMSVDPGKNPTYMGGSKELENEMMERVQALRDRTDDYRAMISVFGSYEILKGLTFTASGGVDYSQANKNLFTPSTLDEKYHENKSEGVISRQISLSTDELLEYKGNIKEKHNFNVLLGFNVNKDQYFYLGGSGKRGASDNVYYYPAGKAPSIYDYGKNGNVNIQSTTTYISDFSEKIMVSYFGRFGYNYKQRYLLEATFRRDGSSTFGEGNKWANFPSVALGWAFSDESFMRWTSSWLNWGKVRASYGTSGQIFTDPYLAHGMMKVSSKGFNGNAAVTTESPISPDLTWEKTEQYDVGLDMDMFNYRLNFKLDYYYKYTSGLIYSVPLPSGGQVYPFSRRTENCMEISNEGLELELTGDILREGPVSWRTKFNIARNWNRLEKTNNSKDLDDHVIGRPVNGLYVYKFQGFYGSEDEIPRYYTTNGAEVYKGGVSTDKGVSGFVGYYNLKDLNGDNAVWTDDQYFAGSSLPLAHGGWVNELKWKGFELNVLFVYTLGRKIINGKIGTINSLGPKMFDYRDYSFWTEPGCNSDLPRIGTSVEYMLDRNIEKVNSVSLKQLTLGYDLPRKIVGKAGFNGIRFFATIENLFYLSNYSGENPEVINVYTGVDQGAQYPLPRKWTLGLTLNF